jgi:hypothetical protein
VVGSRLLPWVGVQLGGNYTDDKDSSSFGSTLRVPRRGVGARRVGTAARAARRVGSECGSGRARLRLRAPVAGATTREALVLAIETRQLLC